MTTSDLESRLEGGIETQAFEVKASCAWNADSMAKDILAMSNVKDGGYIVIGVEDGTFVRQGVNGTHKTTYNVDVMRDQMARFADPHVNFNVYFTTDSNGLEYAVIQVQPFSEQPVICRTNGRDVRAGVVYYRNRSGRVQSAAVSNAHDMREIITTATIKMMQGMAQIGLYVPQQQSAEGATRDKFAAERNGL